jgi:hypothetical protein
MGRLVSSPLAHRWYLPTCPVLGDRKVRDVTSPRLLAVAPAFGAVGGAAVAVAAPSGKAPTTAAPTRTPTRASAATSRRDERGAVKRPFLSMSTVLLGTCESQRESAHGGPPYRTAIVRAGRGARCEPGSRTVLDLADETGGVELLREVVGDPVRRRTVGLEINS